MFPWDDLQSITAQILARRDGNTLQYGATRGYRPLIEHLLAHTLSARGISSRFEDVIITSGSQQGLDLVGRVLIDPGDPVIVELPTYSGAIAAFHNLQASLVGVPQDAEGIEIAAARSRRDRSGEAGQAGEVHLRHAELPEPGRPVDERASAGASCSTPRDGTTS